MNYNVRWIQKYLGISRKTLSVYEEKGFIVPIEKPDDEYRMHKYHEYSYEDVVRIWYIKLLVKMGYSLNDIQDMSDPNYDFRDSIDVRIEALEKEKVRYEQLIGHAKMIKATGVLPALPKEMGSITFDEFLERAHETWNINADEQSTAMYQLLQHQLEGTEVWDEETLVQVAQMMEDEGVDLEAMVELQVVLEQIVQNQKLGTGHPQVQALTRKFCEVSKRCLGVVSINDRNLARHLVRGWTVGDIGLANEKVLGKAACEFIAEAIAIYGGFKGLGDPELN